MFIFTAIHICYPCNSRMDVCLVKACVNACMHVYTIYIYICVYLVQIRTIAVQGLYLGIPCIFCISNDLEGRVIFVRRY